MLPPGTAAVPNPTVSEKRSSGWGGPASWRTTSRYRPPSAGGGGRGSGGPPSGYGPPSAGGGVVTAWRGPAGVLRCTSVHAPVASTCSTARLPVTAGEVQARLKSRGVPAVGAISRTVPVALAG